jgi:hypothetical protein
MDIKPPYGYQDIVPLTKTQRVQLQESRSLPAQFRGLSALPLSFSEFAPAVRDYPIAFISGDAGKSFVAMALLGVEAQQNLFVDSNDVWDPAAYLPAYVRRHPFCMTRVSVNGTEQAERVACVEKNAVQPKGAALFDDKGEPLPLWDGLRKLLFEFETDLARTEDMTRKLHELQLLEPFSAQVAPTGEQTITLTGMHRVSEEKLHALPADTLKELAQSGMLARVYLHLLSLSNFQRLLDRRATRRAQEKKAPKPSPKKPN